MDGENTYESDISESWSLIDINLNEESLSAAEAYSKLENNPVENGQREKSSVDFSKKEVNETDFSHRTDCETDPFKNQGLPSNDLREPDRIDLSFERNLEDINKHDSCDAESIEILDMDGNYPDSEIERLDISQINQLNFSTYRSDDEESLEGNNNEIRNSNSPVIKRRKRILNKNLEPVNSINSESRSPTDNNLADPEEQNKLNVKSNEGSSHPVYKHYRNNVANTALSLSVGVIFAGVACIAIGHFLGVQDAAQTAVELVETLKKLEVENAALQSHLHQLNKALLIREINPKSERPLSPLGSSQSKVSCQQYEAESSKTQTKTDFSGIHCSLNAMEDLSKLQNYAQKNNKVTATEYGIDFKEFGKLIQDQLHSLKTKQERGAKVLEEADKKISKELQEIISKLSSSQRDMANLNENVIRLKNIIDKIEKMIPESLEKLRSQSWKRKNKVPVTELDLQSMGWSPKNRESVTLYEFPKPESYYKREENSKKREFTNSKLKNDTSEVGGKVAKKTEKPKNDHKSDRKKRRDKTHSKEVWKKKEFKEKERKWKKNEKKSFFNKLEKVFDPVIGNKRKSKRSETGHTKITDSNMYNRTIFKNEKSARLKNIKSKRKAEKVKNVKLSKLLLTKLKKGSSCLKKRDQNRFYSGPELFNLTGHWIFKWADGREEIRKHQTLSDWQFERAKARKELRDEDYEENWQFKRAVARETNRNDLRGKYSKFTEKEFFHEGFSWI